MFENFGSCMEEAKDRYRSSSSRELWDSGLNYLQESYETIEDRTKGPREGLANLENKLEVKIEKCWEGIKKGARWTNNHVNYKLGSIGASIGGGIAFATNYSHGLEEAGSAFGKQAIYILFAGGFNCRCVQKWTERINSKPLSILAASTFTTLQAGVMMYFYHELLGTPEAFNTAANVSALNLFAFGGLAYYFRKHKDDDTNPLLG
mgnify:CR=1 FL=1